MRVRILAAVVALLVATVGVGGAASANNDGTWSKVPITVGASGADVEVVGSACVPSNLCVHILKVSNVTLTGDFQGSGAGGILGADPNASGIGGFTDTSVFEGHVKACGTGTFIHTTTGTVDANTGTTRQVSNIVRGSGTGDLVGITGTWRPSPDGSTVVGWVRCKVRHGGPST